jgi:hypothetical protein
VRKEGMRLNKSILYYTFEQAGNYIFMSFTKKLAKKMFGKHKILAEALGKTTGAIGHWKDPLTEDQKNMIVGAAARRRMPLPDEVFLDE